MTQTTASICITGTYHPNDERLLGLYSSRSPGQGLRQLFLDAQCDPVRVYRIDKAKAVLDDEKRDFDLIFMHMHEDADYEDARAFKHLVRDSKVDAARLLLVHPKNLNMDVTTEALEWAHFALLGPLASSQQLLDTVRTLVQYKRSKGSKSLVYKMDQYPLLMEEELCARYLSESPPNNLSVARTFTFQPDHDYSFDSPRFDMTKRNLKIFTSIENFLEFAPKNKEARKFLLEKGLMARRRDPKMSLEVLLRDKS